MHIVSESLTDMIDVVALAETKIGGKVSPRQQQQGVASLGSTSVSLYLIILTWSYRK